MKMFNKRWSRCDIYKLSRDSYHY